MGVLYTVGIKTDILYVITVYLVLSLLSLLVIYFFKKKSNKEIEKLEKQNKAAYSPNQEKNQNP